jgi:hypothetical protein
MGLGPPVAARRRALLPVVAVGLVGLVVIIGVIVAVNRNSSDQSSHSVTTLKAVLDRVPIPAGAVLVRETANEQHGDANAFVERQYRLKPSPPSSQQVHDALVQGDCRLVDLQSGEVSPVAAHDWSALVLTTSGDLNVLPQGTKGGGISLNWNGDALYVSVKGGDAELG